MSHSKSVRSPRTPHVLFVLVTLFASAAAFAMPPIEVERGFESLRHVERVGQRVALQNVPLPGGRAVDLELQRIEVFNADTTVTLYGDNGSRRVITPKIPVAFGGSVPGDPDSFVYFRVDDAGDVHGMIASSMGRFTVGPAPQALGKRRGISRQLIADVTAARETVPWSCAVENEQVHPSSDSFAPVSGYSAPEEFIEGMAFASPTAKHRLVIAVDANFEMYTNFGSNTTTVTNFIHDLIGASSVIYQRDVRVELVAGNIGIETTNTLFANQTDPRLGLAEYGDFWHNTPPTAQGTSSAILLAGQAVFSGIAWTNASCDGDLLCNNNCGDATYNGHYAGRYGWIGNIGNYAPDKTIPTLGDPDALIPDNYWPLLAFTHELGHNVGSGHTHCMTLSGPDQVTYARTTVDSCVNCATGVVGVLANVPPEQGTIMSYCHLINDGATIHSRFLFGRTGEATSYVVDFIRNYLDSVISEPSVISAPSSLPLGAGGVASVTGSGVTYQWEVTNGTINGSSTAATVNFTASANPVTVKVTATGSFGCATTDFVTIPVIAANGPEDFNADGKDDLIWRQPSTGTNVLWAMNGAGRISYTTLLSVPGTMWEIGGTGDFDGNAKPDILWRNSVTGQNVVWTMNGAVRQSIASILAVPAGWEVGGVGDFDGDGDADIVWRNGATGQNVMWFMNGLVRQSYVTLLSVPGAQWRIVATGDFDGDGDADIVWRNGTTGQNVVWFMAGSTRTSFASLLTVADPAWRIMGAADWDGDSDADLFWRNVTTGQNTMWFMNGAVRTSYANTLPVADTSWAVHAPR